MKLVITRVKAFEWIGLCFFACGCGVAGGILMLVEVHLGWVNTAFWLYSSTLLGGIAMFCFWLSVAYDRAAKEVLERVA